MPIYKYKCSCGLTDNIVKPMSKSDAEEPCMSCGKVMQRVYTAISIVGTRDSFGIGKEFKDEATGQTIDTWKKWEKAGYKNALESPNLPARMKNEVKRKINKINKYDTGKKFSVGGK